MGFFMQCFSIEELEKLDPAQLEMLRRAVEREVGSNPEIMKILRQKLEPTLNRMSTAPKPKT